MNPELFQCPFNSNHYVPLSSMEAHKKKCQFAVHFGTSIYSLDREELASMDAKVSSFLYEGTSAECIETGKLKYFF